MLYSRILRGFRMFRRLREAWLVLIALTYFQTTTVQGTTWYCKDTLCSEPMSKGLAGYEYNPSEAAIQHGYLPLSPGKVLTAYKVSNSPDIFEVEVDGKRGFVPRTLYDVSTNFMGKAEFVVTEGPTIMSEQDATSKSVQPSVDQLVTSTETPQLEEEKLLSSTVSPLLPIPQSADVLRQEIPSIPDAQNLEKEISPEKTAEKVEEVDPDKVAVPTPGFSEEERPIAPIQAEETSASATVLAPPKGPVVEAVVTSAPPPYHSTEDISRGLSDASIGENKTNLEDAPNVLPISEGDTIVQLNESSDSAKNESPLTSESVLMNSPDRNETAGEEISSKTSTSSPAPSSVDVELSPAPSSFDVELSPALSSVDVELSPAPSSVDAEFEKKVVIANDTLVTGQPAEEQPIEVRPAMDLEVPSKVSLENSTPPLPPLPVVISKNLDEIAKKLGGPSSVVPPPSPVDGNKQFTESGGSGSEPSLVEILASSVEKRPEPTVVFQQADYRSSLPGFYHHKADQPVLSTKAFLRHHHHNHDHHHHDHAHDHNHGGHDHHDHSHSGPHGHDHGDSTERSHQVRHTAVAPPAPEAKLHVTKESLAGQIHPHDVPTDTSSDLVVTRVGEAAVFSTPQFIPPENATQSPVDYEELVRDRMEGKTVPGLLSDDLKRNPSEGVPTPPQLDPSTATEAPRLPGLSENALPLSEEEAAIDSNPRYNRRRPGHSDGNPQHQLASSGGVLQLPQSQDHHHDHDHSLENRHGDSHYHGEKPVESRTVVPTEGTCHSGSLAGEGSCEEFVALNSESQNAHFPEDFPSSNLTGGAWNSYLDMTADTIIHGWMRLVVLFETTSGSLRLAGMFIFAVFTLVSVLSAASDRGIRRTLERGFEEYDYKKEKELLTLREQVQVLLKQNQELASGSTVAPSPSVPPPPPQPQRQVSLPCGDCEGLRSSLQQLSRTIGDKEHNLKDLRDSHSTLLSRNNEVVTELRLMVKDRDDLARQLEDFRSRLMEAERRLRSSGNGKREPDRRPSAQADLDADMSKLHLRLQQLETENSSLRESAQRDQSSVSDVRLLRQLLGEKEDEIRKIRATEMAGGLSHGRELQEKTEDLRAAKKQLLRLQQELESVKRDRETQLQIRCQSFRSAADKAQRDALMARQETLAVRQLLEEVCRRHGEQPPTVTQVLANGAVTPPGLMPLMFAGLGFPSGPPPPSLEAFKQQVLMQQQDHSSGHSSPRSPDDSERDRRREKRTVKKSHTLDFSQNGKDAHDLDEARKRDRSYR